MFCPGCGKGCLEELRFCNNCGTNLQAVKQALSGPGPQSLPVAPQQTINTNVPVPIPEHFINFERNRQRLKKAGVLLLLVTPVWAAMMEIIGSLFINISWELSHFIRNMAEFGGLFFMCGIALLIYMKVMYKTKDFQQFVALQQGNSSYTTQSLPQATPQQLNASPLIQATPTVQSYTDANLPPGRPLFADRTGTTMQQPPHNMDINGMPQNNQYPLSQSENTEKPTGRMVPPDMLRNKY